MKIYLTCRGLYISQLHQTKTEIILRALVYDKLLELPSLGLKYFETGMITNFVTSDVVTIAFNYRYLISLAVVPVMLVTMTTIVYIKFSWAAFTLPVLFLIMVFLQ